MPFTLTKQHVHAAFAPLASTSSEQRGVFFAVSVRPNVIWTIPGPASSLTGTRRSVEAHTAATHAMLQKRLTGPIRFGVARVIVDGERTDDGWWAVVELRGEAVRLTGEPYNNEYVWLTRFDDEGKIVEIRSYFDTLLAEQVLKEPVIDG